MCLRSPDQQVDVSKRKRARRLTSRQTGQRHQAENAATGFQQDDASLTSFGRLLLLPSTIEFALSTIKKIEVELLPLYTMIAVLRQGLAEYSYSSTVIPSAQVVRGLEYLGFKAQLIAACATLVQSGEPPRQMTDLGTWESPPVIREDGTTDAHTVIWADSFSRCIDLSICQHPAVKAAAPRTDSVDTTPAVLPAKDLDTLLNSAKTAAYFRGPYAILLVFTAPWTKLLDPLLERQSQIVEQGGLALAHAVLDQLFSISAEKNLEELIGIYPTLGDLLTERTRLPGLQLTPPIAPMASPGEY